MTGRRLHKHVLSINDIEPLSLSRWDQLSEAERSRWNHIAKSLSLITSAELLPLQTSDADTLADWIKNTPPLVLMQVFRILYRLGYRMATAETQIQTEQLRTRDKS